MEKHGSVLSTIPNPQIHISAQTPFRLPAEAFIYGIAYDALGFMVYSFFPRVTKIGGARDLPTQWGYGCEMVDANHVSVFKKQGEARLMAFRALLVVKCHARKLSGILRKVTLPKELLTCHELWDQEKLWSN